MPGIKDFFQTSLNFVLTVFHEKTKKKTEVSQVGVKKCENTVPPFIYLIFRTKIFSTKRTRFLFMRKPLIDACFVIRMITREFCANVHIFITNSTCVGFF